MGDGDPGALGAGAPRASRAPPSGRNACRRRGPARAHRRNARELGTVTRFLAFAARQNRGTAAARALMALAGLLLALRLPAAILPEVTFPRITIIADSGERPAEEMVRLVTRPVEESLRRVPEIEEIRSTTSRGSTEIQIDCDW